VSEQKETVVELSDLIFKWCFLRLWGGSLNFENAVFALNLVIATL